MRKFFLSYILIFLVGALVGGCVVGVEYYLELHANHPLLSPLPEFLSRVNNNQVSTVNLFLPHVQTAQAQSIGAPEITAGSAILYDVTSGKLIYSKNPNQELPMASLTKIMTAVVAMEHKKPDDRYIVKKQDLVGEDSMGLTEGEVLRLEELLYGLILASGNDAAETIASNYPSGREQFVMDMNKKAQALGLSHTHFPNPSGLQGDGEQFTTAYDLLIITKYALENFSLFDQIVATFDHTIPQTSTHKAYFLENETNLLTTYPGVKGVKTGYTPEAGLCLVTYFEKDDHKIIGVLLNSNNRRDEMKNLLDFAQKTLGFSPSPRP